MNLRTKTIEMEELVLRKFQLEDLNSLYTWASKEEVSRYLSWESPKSLEDLEEQLEEIIKSYEENTEIHWALADKSKDEVLGSIRIYPDSKEELNLEFSIDDKYLDSGYIEKGIEGSIEYIKKEFPNIKYIKANILAVNIPYIDIIKSLGFTFENTKIMSLGKLKDRYTFIYKREIV